jgi:hypothetical protein
VLLSIVAVYCVGRVVGPLGALVLATSPIQLAYAAEINNYPLGVALVGACLLAAKESWRWAAVMAIAAAWAHVLAAFAGLGLIVWRLVRDRGRLQSRKMALMAFLGMLPVGAGAVNLLSQEGTFGQGGESLAWLQRAVHAIGPEGLLMSGLALLAWRHPAAWIWGAMAVVLAGALALGIASAEQIQYLPLLGPPAAVLIGAGVAGLRAPRLHRLVVWLVALACLVRGGRFMASEMGRIAAILEDQSTTRAVDLAVDGSGPGDTIWLVAPANQLDDDKTATAAVLWRLPPWSPMPLAYPVDFEYRDYRYGQPRTWQDRTVHSSTELYAAPFDAIAQSTLKAEGELWVVLYEYEHAQGLVARIERVLRPYEWEMQEVPRGEHSERLYRITSLRTES